MRPLVAPHLAALKAYIPGKPIEETEREYGVSGIAKLASNENCLGPSPRALDAVRESLLQSHLYPDAGGFYLKERICSYLSAYGVGPQNLVLGNGTNEILTLLVRAFVGEGEAGLIAWPSFVVYRLALAGQNRQEVSVPLREDLGYDLPAMADALEQSETPIKVVFLANPNNPTGRYFGQVELDAFLARVPEDVVVVLDEAYAEYVQESDYPEGMRLALSRPRTIVTRTFSKAYGLAALRVGYAVCDPEIADVLNRLREPFNVNSVGQQAAMAALDDAEHVQRSIEHNQEELPKIQSALEKMGILVTPSVCNFVLMHLPEGFPTMAEVNEGLLQRGVIVRPVANYGLPRSARVTIGTEAENQRFLHALEEICASYLDAKEEA